MSKSWEGSRRKDGVGERPTRQPPPPPKGQGARRREMDEVRTTAEQLGWNEALSISPLTWLAQRAKRWLEIEHIYDAEQSEPGDDISASLAVRLAKAEREREEWKGNYFREADKEQENYALAMSEKARAETAERERDEWEGLVEKTEREHDKWKARAEEVEVLACNLNLHNTRLAKRIDELTTRADKAERERDEARTHADDRDGLLRAFNKMRDERDEWKARAEKAEALLHDIETSQFSESMQELGAFRERCQVSEAAVVKFRQRAEKAERERNQALAACRAFVEAWDKSHQLEKTDVAYRLAREAIEECGQ